VAEENSIVPDRARLAWTLRDGRLKTFDGNTA
jgi:hypothetical protein